jgi:hypothetical protein
MIWQCGATVTYDNDRLIRFNKFVSPVPKFFIIYFIIRTLDVTLQRGGAVRRKQSQKWREGFNFITLDHCVDLA